MTTIYNFTSQVCYQKYINIKAVDYTKEQIAVNILSIVFHTSITKGIKGGKEGRQEGRKGGEIGQHKASNYLPGSYLKVSALLSLGKRRVSSAVRLDGPYEKWLGMDMVGAGGISWPQRNVRSRKN